MTKLDATGQQSTKATQMNPCSSSAVLERAESIVTRSISENHRGRMKHEPSNALLYMGRRRHANPHPSDTFQVTLRGETAPVSGHAEEKPSGEVSQGKKDATFDRLTPFAKHVGRSMLTVSEC
jgi:hypothetical protein